MTTRKPPAKGRAPGKAEATPGGVAMVPVGKRYSRLKARGDRYGPVTLDKDVHHLLRTADIKAWALGVLEEAGIDTHVRIEHAHQNEGRWLRERVACDLLKPLKFAEDSNGTVGIADGAGYEHDDLPSLAARAYELAREVELATEDPDPRVRAQYARSAHQTGYELGRVSMLARVYGFDSAQRKGASKAPRPGARDPLRARIIEALNREKTGGTEFKVVMSAWERDSVLHGLTITRAKSGPHAGKYLIADDWAAKRKAKPYTWGTLLKMYSQAG